MFNQIKHYITTHIDPRLEKPLLTGKPHILVGLSGGPDSVFLIHFLNSLRKESLITISAAHLNHGWRESANRDELFCEQLCSQLNIPFYASHLNSLSTSFKFNGSKEEIGRKMRQYFFTQVKTDINADSIALAHHQQDQEETFFMRLIRGCSLQGLTGIKAVHRSYIRPLLATTKNDILNYLNEHNLPFVIDPSNKSNNFLRNRIRNQVIPILKKIDPRFSQKFNSSLTQLEEENNYLKELSLQTILQIFTQTKQHLVGDQKQFVILHPVIQKRIIIEWLCQEKVPFTPSQGLLEEIIRFLKATPGSRHSIHQHWLIQKKKGKFWIEKSE